MVRPLTLLADNGDAVVGFWHKATFLEALLATAAFGALGIVLLFLGYKVFDWLTPKLDIEKELAEKNMAVAVVMVAVILSIGLIIARTVG
jgi:putative membrane protein